MSERAGSPVDQPRSSSEQGFTFGRWGPATFLTIVVIVLAAIILNPASAGIPIVDPLNRTYWIIIVVTVVVMTMFIGNDNFAELERPRSVVFIAMFTVSSTGAFLIDRVNLISILVVMAAGALASAAGYASSARTGAMILSSWMFVASLATLSIRSLVTVPILSGAIYLLAWSAMDLRATRLVVPPVGWAIVAGQLYFSIRFLPTTPAFAASIWLGGILLMVASSSYLESRQVS